MTPTWLVVAPFIASIIEPLDKPVDKCGIDCPGHLHLPRCCALTARDQGLFDPPSGNPRVRCLRQQFAGELSCAGRDSTSATFTVVGPRAAARRRVKAAAWQPVGVGHRVVQGPGAG